MRKSHAQAIKAVGVVLPRLAVLVWIVSFPQALLSFGCCSLAS
jgi:hypothetical protein